MKEALGHLHLSHRSYPRGQFFLLRRLYNELGTYKKILVAMTSWEGILVRGHLDGVGRGFSCLDLRGQDEGKDLFC